MRARLLQTERGRPVREFRALPHADEPAGASAHCPRSEFRLQAVSVHHCICRVNAELRTEGHVCFGGSVKGVLPKGPERGPLSPRAPFGRGFGGIHGGSQRADMAVRAPIRFGQHALRMRPARCSRWFLQVGKE